MATNNKEILFKTGVLVDPEEKRAPSFAITWRDVSLC